MKKTLFQIAVAVMLLLMGCSKDELINDTSENGQLKKGRMADSGITSLNFVGNSVKDGDFFHLTELGDKSVILKNGKCSGSITGYGKINPTLSNYSFSPPVKKDNPNYGIPGSERELRYDFDIDVKGIVKINTIDYFEFSLTQALYSPANYEAGLTGPGEPPFKGAIFGCPLGKYYFVNGEWTVIYQGDATITLGAGKFETFTGRKLEVYRNGGTKGINRVTGEISLIFRIK